MPGAALNEMDMLKSRVLLGLGAGMLFLLAGLLSGLVAPQDSGVEALWPANAVVLGLMIVRKRWRGELAAVIVGGVIASLALHGIGGSPPVMAVLWTGANALEWAIAYTLLRRLWDDGELLDHSGNIFALLAACSAALLVTSNVGALGLNLAYHVPYAGGMMSWFASHLLSYLLVTPAVVIVGQLVSGRRLRGLDGRAVGELAAILGLVAAISSYVFFMTRLPMTFAVVPFVLLATFRFRAPGAVAAMAILTVISAYATATGHGMIAHTLSDPAQRIVMLQTFLGGTFLAALPLAAMLNERDIHAEDARMLADHFRSVVENLSEVIFRIDRDGRWAYLNPAWEMLSGVPIRESIGRRWSERFAEEDQAKLKEESSAVLNGQMDSIRRALRFDTPTGPRWVELLVQALHDSDGRVSGATGTLRDIHDRKQREETVIIARRRAEQRAREATLLATTDELTGIANRRAFMNQLQREIAGAAEFGWPLAVALFDVDHFKLVNDRYGHAVGDRVLQQVARRAAGIVRAGDLVGRVGGEEFGIVMPGASAEDASRVAERLREAMSVVDPDEVGLPSVTVSIGIASRQRQRDATTLLAAADAALYSAKDAGRNRVRIAA
jgi:diguanylate cyclase (GGDEF)-like protein/PAS domain S-box-containing protein